MTPLIAEMVGVIPDLAADMMWFDINDAWQEKQEMYNHSMALEGLQNPLPFMRCALVVVDGNGDKTLTMVANAVRPDRGDQAGLAVASIVLQHGKLGVFAPFFCDPFEENVEKGLTIYFNDRKHDDDPKMTQGAMASLVAISFWQKMLNQKKIVSYQPQKRPGHAKRIRQGKKPMFDWTTVVLEPRSVKESEALGGTHSSPRQHDVRGHWVTRNNKRFWRKPHKRGDASLGVIFKDYQLKGERNADL
jgi:hypothetical protein